MAAHLEPHPVREKEVENPTENLLPDVGTILAKVRVTKFLFSTLTRSRRTKIIFSEKWPTFVDFLGRVTMT